MLSSKGYKARGVALPREWTITIHAKGMNGALQRARIMQHTQCSRVWSSGIERRAKADDGMPGSRLVRHVGQIKLIGWRCTSAR